MDLQKIVENIRLLRTLRGYSQDGLANKIGKSQNSQQYKFNKFNLSPTISLGIDYTITEKFNFKIEPTFRYGILKIIDAPLISYLWSAGLNMSFYCTFKN